MVSLPELIRAALPNWMTDPYQHKAHLAISRIFNAAAVTEERCNSVGAVIAYFLEDPPTSLLYDNPAATAEALATQLEALAQELRKGVEDLRYLAPYVNQFHSPSSEIGVPDGGSRQLHQRIGAIPEEQPDDPCPF